MREAQYEIYRHLHPSVECYAPELAITQRNLSVTLLSGEDDSSSSLLPHEFCKRVPFYSTSSILALVLVADAPVSPVAAGTLSASLPVSVFGTE